MTPTNEIPEIVSGTTAGGEAREPGTISSLPVGGPFPDEGLAPIDAPRDLPGAEALLVQLGEDEEEIAAIDASAAKAIQTIEKRRDSIKGKAERRAAYLRLLLEEYAKSHRGEIVRGGKKSRELLGGTIGFRMKPEKVVVEDEATVIAWAELAHLELLDMRPRIDKRALSAFVAKTGELPPGVDVESAEETVHVKTHPLPTLNTPKAPKEIE